MKNAVKALSRWWHGEFVTYNNDPHSGVFILGWTKKHWSSRLAHLIAQFFLREWKWAIGTCLAITGLTMTYARFF